MELLWFGLGGGLLVGTSTYFWASLSTGMPPDSRAMFTVVPKVLFGDEVPGIGGSKAKY